MKIKQILTEKKAWRQQVARVNALPKDYQVLYKEIQKYLFKVGEANSQTIMQDLLAFFEENASAQRSALEVVGDDVAAFCEALIVAHRD